MVPKYVRWYGDYDYNWNGTWDPDSWRYENYTDLLSSYIDETQIQNIIGQIINCNYTIEKNNDVDSNADAENNDGSTPEVNAMTRDNNDVAVNFDNFDQGTVCGISQSDLMAAMLYTQKGFLINFK